jgi:large subunit ribosomal protein L24
MKKIEGTGRLHVKKGDTVVILSGKDRGATGTVQTAFPSLGKVTVEGLNMVTRHQKPKRDSPFGQIQQGVVRKPAALWVAKVMLQFPHCH